MNTRTRVIVVGTIANSTTENPDEAGCTVWGPFLQHDAEIIKAEIDAIFATVDSDDQIYGTPYCEIQPLMEPGATAQKMAGNWFRDPEED